MQNSTQPTLNYLGKVFGLVESFRNSDRAKAEKRCGEMSRDGKLSLLVEFIDTWVLYCEGVTPKIMTAPVSAAPTTPIQPIRIQPQINHNIAPETPPIPAPAGATPVVVTEESEPEYIEIQYRGSIIRKPVNSSNTGAAQGSRSYRGTSY